MNPLAIVSLGGFSLLGALLLDAYSFKGQSQELLKLHIAFFGGVAFAAVF